MLLGRPDCAAALQTIQDILTIIQTLRETDDAVMKASVLAKRALSVLKKIIDLDPMTRGLENRLRLIQVMPDLAAVKAHASIAQSFIEPLQEACGKKVRRKARMLSRMAMARGPYPITYGRVMRVPEYSDLVRTKELAATEPGQTIPAFLAPPNIIAFFLKIDKTAVKNIYSQMGGTGSVDCIVFFQTDILPVQAGGLRKYRGIQEVKFATGTPVEIVQVRRL